MAPTARYTDAMVGESIVVDTAAPIEVLVQQLLDIPSPSGSESALAGAIEKALNSAPHLEVLRVGNTIAARTNTGRKHRVVWAGHTDTVPVHYNLPSQVRDGFLWDAAAST